jgi:hypothetical protein
MDQSHALSFKPSISQVLNTLYWIKLSYLPPGLASLSIVSNLISNFVVASPYHPGSSTAQLIQVL